MKKFASMLMAMILGVFLSTSTAFGASLVTIDTTDMTDTITAVGVAAIAVVLLYIAYPIAISTLKRIFGRAS